jgi:hypothetical protein
MPNDVPPWHTVSQQAQCWLTVGTVEVMVRNLRMLMRAIQDLMPQLRATMLGSRTLPSTRERGGYWLRWVSALH